MNYKKLLYQLKLQEDGTVSPKEDTVLKAWVRVPAGFSVITNSGIEVPPGGILNLGQAKLEDGQPVDDFNKFQQWNQNQGKGYKIDQTGEPVDDSQVTSREKDIAPGSPKKKMARTYQSDIDQYWSSLGGKVTPTSVAKMVDYRNRIEFLVNSSNLPDEDKAFIVSRIDSSVSSHIGADLIYEGSAIPIETPSVTRSPDSITPDQSPKEVITQKPILEKITAKFLETVPVLMSFFSKAGYKNLVSAEGTKINMDAVHESLGENHPLNINSHINNVVSLIKDEDERAEKKKEIIEKLLSLTKGKSERKIFDPVYDSQGNIVGITFSKESYGVGNSIGLNNVSMIRDAILEAMGTSSASVGIFSIFPVSDFGKHISKQGLSQKQEAAIRFIDSHPLNKVYFEMITSPFVMIGDKKVTILDAITIEDEVERRYAVQQLIEKGVDKRTNFGKDYAKSLDKYLKNGAFRYPPDDKFIDSYGMVYEAASDAALGFSIASYEQKADDRSIATVIAIDSVLKLGSTEMGPSVLTNIFKFGAALGVNLGNYHVSNDRLTQLGIDLNKLPSDLVTEEQSLSDSSKAVERLAQICSYINRKGIECGFTHIALGKAFSVDADLALIAEASSKEIFDLDSVQVGADNAAIHINSHGLNVKKALKTLSEYSKKIEKDRKISGEDKKRLISEEQNRIVNNLKSETFEYLANALGSSEDVDPAFVDYIVDMEFRDRGHGAQTGYYTESFGNVLLLAGHIKNRKQEGLSHTVSYSLGGDSQNPHILEVSFSDDSGSKVETAGVLSHSQLSRGTADSLFYSNKDNVTTSNIVEQKLGETKLVANAGEPHGLVDLLTTLHTRFHSEDQSKKVQLGSSKNLRFNIDDGTVDFCSMNAYYSGASVEDQDVQRNGGASFYGRELCK